MTQAAPTLATETWERERFERNLRALAERQPGTARRVGEWPIPDSVRPALGRDGTATFQLLGPDGRRHWLGRTSMPSTSAPAVIEHFDAGGGNALLPLIGTGAECDLLCRRLARHGAVFVYESEPLNLKLALHVTELVEPLLAGRLVVLAFGPLEEVLPAYLADHPGYEFPHRLLVHPAVERPHFERLRLASEAAAAAVNHRQLQSVREAAGVLAGRARPTVGERPHVVVLSSDPRSGALETVGQLAAALGELSWPSVVHAPSGPGDCHNLARLLSIRDHRPDLVLTFNSCTGRLTEFIPEHQPVASWFWPGSAVEPAVKEGCGSSHHVFGATPALCRQLLAAGVPDERVHLLEVGVDTTCFRPDEAVRPDQRQPLRDVAILADAVDCSAAAAGIEHGSQVTLWDRIREVTVRRAQEYAPSLARSIVKEAEHSTGMRMNSEEVRDKFATLLRHRLALPAVIEAVVGHLRGAGVRVRVWGSGWRRRGQVGEVVCGPIPDPPGRRAIYQSAGVVMFPLLDRSAVQSILEVAASGGYPIFRPPQDDLAALHPMTAEVLGLLPQYDRFATLLSLVREARVANSKPTSNVARARRLVAEGHSLVARWMTIRDLMR